MAEESAGEVMAIDMTIAGLAFPKGEPRRKEKARTDRAAAKVVKSVRQRCVERDGDCRRWLDWFRYQTPDQALAEPACLGVSEWAHLHVKRRSQTRGQAAETRHTTADSLMLCRKHHQNYDAHRLQITCLTRKGADGRLKFTKGKT